jgi:hypothetical protein
VQHAPDIRTPIADLVAKLLADGCAGEVIVQAVAAAEREARQVPAGASKRGRRLPEGWLPSSSAVSFALERGLSPAEIEVETEKFRNYWTAKAGQGAIKLDWEATWRNWIISTAERRHGPSPAHRVQASPSRYRTCVDRARCHPCRHGSPRASPR